MPDELDPLLLRRFAQSRAPLADARFVAQVEARLPAYSLRDRLLTALLAALQAGLTGVFTGIAAPLRLRNAGIVALAALGFAVWSIVQSSL